MPFNCGQRLRRKKRNKLPELVAESNGDNLFTRAKTCRPWMQKTSATMYRARGKAAHEHAVWALIEARAVKGHIDQNEGACRRAIFIGRLKGR